MKEQDFIHAFYRFSFGILEAYHSMASHGLEDDANTLLLFWNDFKSVAYDRFSDAFTNDLAGASFIPSPPPLE